jgi:hypothetical protein
MLLTAIRSIRSEIHAGYCRVPERFSRAFASRRPFSKRRQSKDKNWSSAMVQSGMIDLGLTAGLEPLDEAHWSIAVDFRKPDYSTQVILPLHLSA